MYRYLINEFAESRSKKIASQGLGPFFSDTCHAFLEGICVSCEREIPDSTIFGNAFVVKDNGIWLLCDKCRIGQSRPLNVVEVNDDGIEFITQLLKGGFNRAKILLYVSNFLKKHPGEWMTVLCAFRLQYGALQDPKYYPRAFEKKYRQIAIKELYGDLFIVGNCPECAAAWSPWFKEDRQVMEESGKCWSCSFPNHQHWHMRDTFQNEYKKFEKYKLSFTPPYPFGKLSYD